MLDAQLSDNSQEVAFLKKLGMNIEDAMPTGKEIKKSLKYFSLGVKIEVMLVGQNNF